jgi:purine-binding chemotaxis protein CheW
MFRVGTDTFAFHLQDVAEIIRLPAVAKMPLAPPSLLGLANLRGAVLPVIALGRLLGAGEFLVSEASRVVVIDRGGRIGLVVDRIDGLLARPADRLTREDAAAGGIDPDLLDGAITGEEGAAAIRILDPQRLLRGEFATLGVSTPRADSHIAIAARSAGTSAPAPQALVPLLSFDLGGQEYALPLAAVQEIIPLPGDVSEVPRPETAVLGVVTLRDRLLPLVSLRTLLGLPDRVDREPPSKVVVLAVGGGVAGVVVDTTRDILRVDPALIDTAPVLLSRGEGDAEIASICRLDQGRRLVAVLSPERLFRTDLMQRLLSEQGDATDMATEATAMTDQQFILFRLGDQDYGLPIAAVGEVARPPEQITRLPKAPAFIDGMINLRGEVVPVIDMRRRLDLGAMERTAMRRILVLAMAGGKTGFMVDSVSEVRKIPEAAISVAPEVSADSRLIDRVANLDAEGMVLLIDPSLLLNRVEADLLAAFGRKARDPALKAS